MNWNVALLMLPLSAKKYEGQRQRRPGRSKTVYLDGPPLCALTSYRRLDPYILSPLVSSSLQEKGCYARTSERITMYNGRKGQGFSVFEAESISRQRKGIEGERHGEIDINNKAK